MFGTLATIQKFPMCCTGFVIRFTVWLFLRCKFRFALHAIFSTWSNYTWPYHCSTHESSPYGFVSLLWIHNPRHFPHACHSSLIVIVVKSSSRGLKKTTRIRCPIIPLNHCNLHIKQNGGGVDHKPQDQMTSHAFTEQLPLWLGDWRASRSLEKYLFLECGSHSWPQEVLK